MGTSLEARLRLANATKIAVLSPSAEHGPSLNAPHLQDHKPKLPSPPVPAGAGSGCLNSRLGAMRVDAACSEELTRQAVADRPDRCASTVEQAQLLRHFIGVSANTDWRWKKSSALFAQDAIAVTNRNAGEHDRRIEAQGRTSSRALWRSTRPPGWGTPMSIE